jgi:hypothetical protein
MPFLLFHMGSKKRTGQTRKYFSRSPWNQTHELLHLDSLQESIIGLDLMRRKFPIPRKSVLDHGGSAQIKLFKQQSGHCSYFSTCDSDVPSCQAIAPVSLSYRLTGGVGAVSTHKPFLASRASFSSFFSSVLPGAYFRYHQHHPALTRSWLTFVPSSKSTSANVRPYLSLP